MRRSQIEAWVLQILRRAGRGEPLEDSRVELKREWPADAFKAARRLAGHANASRGEPVLWLIGVDEQKGVVGAPHNDLAQWYPAVQSSFDGVAPELTDLNVPYYGQTVVALLFATARAPFVVKHRSEGPVDREVPWREATRVRSAKRDELLRLLVPMREPPDVKVLAAKLSAHGTGVKPGGRPDPVSVGGGCTWELAMSVYVTPRTPDLLVFPAHRFEIEVTQKETFGCQLFRAYVPHDRSAATRPDADIIVDKASRKDLRASYTQTRVDREPGESASVRLRLFPADSDRAVTTDFDLRNNAGWSFIFPP